MENIASDDEIMLSGTIDPTEVKRNSSYKWVVLIFYTTAFTCTLMVSLGFSPIATTINAIYDAQPIILTLCNVIFLVVSVVLTFPMMKII